MLAEKKLLLLFIVFFLLSFFSRVEAWEFYIYHESEKIPKISIENVEPFDLYAAKIQKFFFKTEEMPYMRYSDKISVYYGKLKKLPAKNDRVYIFVVPGKFRGKGGILKIAEAENIRYVFVQENYSVPELCHELCHAIAGLGDEYGGETKDYPETLRKNGGQTRYPNLTWYETDFEDWKRITDRNVYLPGGAGYNSGIFHAYENCLMRDLSQSLCPICRFYLQQAMDVN